jgi:predicted permease
MRWAHRLRVWARSLFRRGRVEHELDAELRFHLDQLTLEQMAHGKSADEARAAALRALGNVAYLKEDCRASLGLRLLDDLTQDLRHTARTLRKNAGFTLAAVLSLALGIGANTGMFTLLDAVIFKPLPVPAANELVTFYENGPEGKADTTGGTGRFLRFSYPRFKRLEEALASRGSMAAVTRGSRFTIRLPGSTASHFVLAQLVSGQYFATLNISAARGRLLTEADLRPDQSSLAAVVSDGLWKRMLGGSDAVVGQTIAVNGVTVTIVGVAPPGFFGMWTDAEAELWLPLTLQQALKYANNSSSYARIDESRPWFEQDHIAWLNLVARIRPADRPQVIPLLQATNQQGAADLASLMENPRNRASMVAHTLGVEPLTHGFSFLRGQFADTLLVLTGLVALVMLVTCANIANLLLARAAGNARDIGVRIMIGASTGRLVRQCLTESLVLALLGGALGYLVGEWGSQLLARQVLGTSGELPQVFAPDARVFAFATGLSIVTAIVFGLAPALRAIRVGRSAAVVANQRQAVGHATMRGMRVLVIGQLALSVVVVFAALLFGRTLINFTRIDPGFTAGRLLTVSFDPIVSEYTAEEMTAFGHRVVNAVQALPGVASAAVSRCGLVAGCSSSAGFRVESAEQEVNASFNENWITPGYFSTVGIPLVSGREFDNRDTTRSMPVAIVNESIARRYFAGRDPIGRRLGTSALDTEIVGVVRDARTQSLHDQPVPMVYFPLDQKPVSAQTALTNLDVRAAGDPANLVSSVRDILRQTEPRLLIGDVRPMTARLARDLNRERIVAELALGFGALTMLLASIGLYGLLSYGVARRTQEIGVRMALGARRAEVLRLVAAQSARLAAVGMVLGLAAAAAGSRYLSGMIYGVSPLDPVTFLLVLVAFLLVAACASYLPARRAMNVDPLIALRQE